MTKEPVMTLPNGDIIRSGDYAVTRDGQKVGPIERSPNGDEGGFFCEPMGLYRKDGTFGYDTLNNNNFDIIAKWHPVEAGDFPTSKWRRLNLPPKPATPNYNDGKWHGWNGGECPVHPESVVEYLWHDTNQNRFGSAQRMAGYDENDERPAWPHVIRFRVITPYEEPAPETPPKPAKRDLRTIDEPFGELDERTQKRLRKAVKRGWPVEGRVERGEYRACDNPFWVESQYYRLDPTFTPPPKRRVWWFVKGQAFSTAREAKTAFPGSDPIKVKECKK